MNEHILVCVAWPYAKSSTHVGQVAGAYLPADTFARYHRMAGNRVLMVSGSDEHGTPILVDAERRRKLGRAGQERTLLEFRWQDKLECVRAVCREVCDLKQRPN